ncbi:MAG: hypothetical protein RL033_8127 [Pseudomonadota bacterium]|jgi:hypothetical protein
MKAAFALGSTALRSTFRPPRSARSLCFLLGGALSGIALVVPAAAQTPGATAAQTPAGTAAQTPGATAAQTPSAPQPARYPLDPVCPWGRIADGHGLLVRCLERGEAQFLLAAVAPPAAVAPVAVQPVTVRPAAVPPPIVPPGPPGIVPPPGAVPPAAAVLPPAVALPPLAAAVPAPGAAVAPRSTKIYRRVSVREVGAAVADAGELPEAQVQLRKVQDRYAQCVANNGGLEGLQGRVTVRFLVRERGRAEGVAVKERQGVSMAAAKCVAEVVDRRFVGYPPAPIVGASLSIDFIPEGATR